MRAAGDRHKFAKGGTTASRITRKAKVCVGLIARTAEGFLAAGLPPRESTIDLAPTQGLPALRGVDTSAAPREWSRWSEATSASSSMISPRATLTRMLSDFIAANLAWVNSWVVSGVHGPQITTTQLSGRKRSNA